MSADTSMIGPGYPSADPNDEAKANKRGNNSIEAGPRSLAVLSGSTASVEAGIPGRMDPVPRGRNALRCSGIGGGGPPRSRANEKLYYRVGPEVSK